MSWRKKVEEHLKPVLSVPSSPTEELARLISHVLLVNRGLYEVLSSLRDEEWWLRFNFVESSSVDYTRLLFLMRPGDA